MPGFSDPAYEERQRRRAADGELAEKVSSLRLDVQGLEADIHNLRLDMAIPVCFQCKEQILFQSAVYRCADCGMAFHRECIKGHFANHKPRVDG